MDNYHSDDESSSTSDSSEMTLFEMAMFLSYFILCLNTFLAAAIVKIRQPRRIRFSPEKWYAFLNESLEQDNDFERMIRMPYSSFQKLVSLLRQELLTSARTSRRCQPLLPEVMVFCTIRYLAGGSYLDVKRLIGISSASFYACIMKTVVAVVQCPELAIKFPETHREFQKLASDFQQKSYSGIISNCVGALDGYLLCTITPVRRIVGNVTAYFSGHYKRYGLNVQAVCDAHCRFIYFSVAAPGSSNDRFALKESSLYQLLEMIPCGFCIIGDAAYETSEKLVALYYGVSRKQAKYDNFNFYASQCRIRIEMAFGLMNQKWCILNRPMRNSMENICMIANAIACLHNFCINERLNMDNQEDSEGIPFRTTVQHTHEGDPILNDNDPVDLYDIPGISITREVMAEKVAKAGLERPLRSVLHPINLTS